MASRVPWGKLPACPKARAHHSPKSNSSQCYSRYCKNITLREIHCPSGIRINLSRRIRPEDIGRCTREYGCIHAWISSAFFYEIAYLLEIWQTPIRGTLVHDRIGQRDGTQCVTPGGCHGCPAATGSPGKAPRALIPNQSRFAICDRAARYRINSRGIGCRDSDRATLGRRLY